MDISIIIPIYNVENYLKKCLDSVVNQTKKNIEIILINDGSTDNSGKIASEYSERYNNIKYIEQENRGLGGARNTGLKNAKGEYVLFLDSDDCLELDSCENFIENSNNKTIDIIIGKPVWFKDGKKGDTYLDIFKTHKNKSNLARTVSVVTSQIIRRNLFIKNNIWFPEKRIGEDVVVSLKLSNVAKNYKIINNIVYLRTYRNDIDNPSITQQFNSNIIKDRLINIKELCTIDIKEVNNIYRNYKIKNDLECIKNCYFNINDLEKEKSNKIIMKFLEDNKLEIKKYYFIRNTLNNLINKEVIKTILELVFKIDMKIKITYNTVCKGEI
ncbi:glycosyltransferase family 2 protein [Clostridium perfringens]